LGRAGCNCRATDGDRNTGTDSNRMLLSVPTGAATRGSPARQAARPAHGAGRRTVAVCVGSGFDRSGGVPYEGIPTGGIFAKRERESKLLADDAAILAAQVRDAEEAEARRPRVALLLSKEDAEAGVEIGRLDDPAVSPMNRKAFNELLRKDYIGVDLDHPGLRIHHLDPPLITVDNFWTTAWCNTMIYGCEMCDVKEDMLKTSSVGASFTGSSDGNVLSARRTSQSLLLDAKAIKCRPELGEMALDLQARGKKLLTGIKDAEWTAPGAVPPPGKYCYEGLQAARYNAGDEFKSHEDAFPDADAYFNGFQRRATLLVYLKPLNQGALRGGCTRFDSLDLDIEPCPGRALLFFPAFADGTADPRSVHAALPGNREKWIAQQWVACGLDSDKNGLGPASATSSSGNSSSSRRGRKGRRVVAPQNEAEALLGLGGGGKRKA